MSRTDKTNPYWMQIRRREGAAKGFYEHHHYYCSTPGRPCDLAEPLPVTRRSHRQQCTIWPKCSENNMIYGRRPKRSTRKAIGFENGIRMRLVAQRRDWRLERDRDSIDSSFGAPRRHCQVRDAWHWD